MMSASRVIHLEHLYELAHFSPAIIMVICVIIFILLGIIVACVSSHALKYNLNKLYPNLHRYSFYCEMILIVCIFLSLIYGLSIGNFTSIPENYTRINHVATAVKYQKNLPKLEHQSNGIHKDNNGFLYPKTNRITAEKKYIKKYRYMKPIKKPTMKDYLIRK